MICKKWSHNGVIAISLLGNQMRYSQFGKCYVPAYAMWMMRHFLCEFCGFRCRFMDNQLPIFGRPLHFYDYHQFRFVCVQKSVHFTSYSRVEFYANQFKRILSLSASNQPFNSMQLDF